MPIKSFNKTQLTVKLYGYQVAWLDKEIHKSTYASYSHALRSIITQYRKILKDNQRKEAFAEKYSTSKSRKNNRTR